MLRDNGKVFTGRFATGAGAADPVLFDRICDENGIRHLLTAPYSPITTGKIERFHKTSRVEFFDLHDREWATIEAAQAALDGWVVDYNAERPHRSCGGRPPAERFATRAAEPVPAVATDIDQASPGEPARRPAGVSRWVDQTGSIRLAGAVYRVGSALAGQQVEVVTAHGLVEILHTGVLLATHVQRRRDTGRSAQPTVAGSQPIPARTARNPTSGLSVTRIVDSSGAVSFAGTGYRVGAAWARKTVLVAVVAGSVQISANGKIIRVHAARHDPVKEYGAFAVPGGRPRRSGPDRPQHPATG